ncbi:hypothetical protein DIPPA_60683 [Diplonema papillatum]|nr:hypothetical protein DIPPA_60683 [Diplonema papillatum]
MSQGEGADTHLSQTDVEGLTPIVPLSAPPTENSQQASRNTKPTRAAPQHRHHPLKGAKSRSPHDKLSLISYSVLSTKKRSPAASIVCPRREISIPSIPGPGSYNVCAKPTQPSAPRFEKPVKERSTPGFLTTNDVPGPGSYDSSSFGKYREQGGFTFASKLKETKPRILKPEHPGPAAYQLPTSFGHKASTIYRSTACSLSGRPNPVSLASTASPGPGSYYTISTTGSKGPSLGSKCVPPHHSDVPGPGSYNDPEEIGRKPGKITLKGRTRLVMEQKGQGPSPASYNVSPPAQLPRTKRIK